MSADVLVKPLGERLAERIDAEGPISLHDYMAAANAHYYATRDPLGAGGDFITAPEVSQMFGEMLGAWLADNWLRAGRPADAVYVELGPGRGTLATDALRALAAAGCKPEAHLVETSPVLRAAQARAVPGAIFHDRVDSLPGDRPLMILANEFFDALPVRQYLRTDAGWHERALCNEPTERGARFVPTLVPCAVTLPDATQGSVAETCPAGRQIMAALSLRIAAQGGAMLIVDYGYWGPALGDTVQAVAAHRYADPFADPGARDITAHVDFAALGAAVSAGCRVSPLAGQGAFLRRLGIGARAEALAARHPAARGAIGTALHRLTAPEAMGALFRAMAVTAQGWPEPEGFA